MTDTQARTEVQTASEQDEGVPEHAGELVARLRATFRSGKTKPLSWRREQLAEIVRMLDEHEAEFVQALHDDLRRPAIEAYSADLGNTKGEVKRILKRLGSWTKPKNVIPPMPAQPGRGRIVPEPLGVALIIAPWNYPVNLLLQPLAAAIAAGNAVVLKPSELAPATTELLLRLVPQFLDTDAIALVHGGVPETTALLEQRFDHIFFTGSTAVGKVVMAAAAKHLTPVVLELGGKSPAIVAGDADIPVAARRLVWGKHLNAGQTCIAPDYVLVEDSVRDRLIDEMAKAVGEFLGSDPKASPDFCRIINDSHFERLDKLLATSGGTVAIGGSTDPTERFIEPTVIVDPDLDAPIMQEEIFGPLLPVIGVESIADAVEFVNDRPKPLALYVFSNSSGTVDQVIDNTSSGGACINHTLLHITPDNLPFGGVGPSGMGSYHGKAGFDAFSHHKSVLAKPAKPDIKFIYPPYSALKEKIVRSAL
jgi:aldehyde dehydrogenase (NAD+)